MTAQALMMRLGTISLQAGGRRFTPHDLHRSFVDEILETGAVLSSVERLADQARGRTTQRYSRRGERAKSRAAEILLVPYRGAA